MITTGSNSTERGKEEGITTTSSNSAKQEKETEKESKTLVRATASQGLWHPRKKPGRNQRGPKAHMNRADQQIDKKRKRQSTKLSNCLPRGLLLPKHRSRTHAKDGARIRNENKTKIHHQTDQLHPKVPATLKTGGAEKDDDDDEETENHDQDDNDNDEDVDDHE